MKLVRAKVGGTELTGTVFEPGEERPDYEGVPDDGARYTWVCDEFYEVESGGMKQEIGDKEVNIAFEKPVPRGYDTLEEAMEGAGNHLRTQFSRVGIDESEIEIEIEERE